MTPTPYYQSDRVTLYCGDCRDILPTLDPVWAAIVDPPYGQTNLPWDRWVSGWMDPLPTNSVWCFGSLKMFLAHGEEFDGWTFAQDLVWRKQNGTGFHADRFRRVHEQIAHWYRGPWREVYHSPVHTMDAKPKMVAARTAADHLGKIGRGAYRSVAGGPRLQRSVLEVRNRHHAATHPTEKPVDLLRPLIEYSVPPGGVVLDPFAGSGSTLEAALGSGRAAIGIEVDPTYCAQIVERLRAVA